ncbi:MAG: nitrogen regulation protein NR(II) [Gammaproteobacteria bacterium]|nr:nitrogen regulation protein NR(II) [Gammaproteobacteria bacterium]MDX5375769.1 nitrogen regulation protein NR(II) [Gammaproteobacteria bacterium]
MKTLAPTIDLPILENLHTAVIVLDPQLAIRYLNPAAETLFALSVQRARGLALRELLPGQDDFHADLAQALASAHPYSDREKELVLLSGQAVTVDCTVTPITDPGQPTALLIEMVRIDRQIRITREEHLLQQQSATRALLRGLAHEVKNPLGGLRGAAQLLENELDDEELKEYTRIIIGEADRLQNLVDRMLGPNSLPRIREINIHEVLEHVRSLVGVEAPPDVHLVSDYDPSIPPVAGDRDQLIQVVLNLVRNAVHAVGDTGTITLRTRVQRQYTIGQTRHKLVASIDVIDDGPGIPEEIREKVFFPMVSGKAEGTGLGLSIAQSLINQHGGLIEYESRPGRTQFTILLPVEPVPPTST